MKSSRQAGRPDRHGQNLDQLEGTVWPPSEFRSHLVETIHALRRKPIGEFSIEDLRITIGQNVGLQFLMPIAVEVLTQNPLAEGDFYPGDLLVAVTRVEEGFWGQRPDLRRALFPIVTRVLSDLPNLEPGDRATLERAFGEECMALRQFVSNADG